MSIHPQRITRRTTLRYAAAASVAAVASARAEGQGSLILYGYVGSIEEVFRSAMIPAFEKSTGIKVTYTGQNSSDVLARLIAQKSSPQIDVALLDDGVQLQARTFGLLDKMDAATVAALNELYPVGRLPDDIGAVFAAIPTGIVYNTKTFAERKWASPAAWKDLWRPEFKNHLVLMSAANSIGFYELVMAARINGGDERNIDPGFRAMRELAKSAVDFSKSSDISAYLQQGDAAIGVWNVTRTNILADSGFPVQFVYPVEGSPGTFSTVNVVKGAPHPEAARRFADFLLSAEAQKIVATKMGSGPLNRNVKLSPEEAARVPYGETIMGRIVRIDWEYINPRRAEWIDRWNKEVENQ